MATYDYDLFVIVGSGRASGENECNLWCKGCNPEV